MNAKKLRRCSGEPLLQLLEFCEILASVFLPIAHLKTRNNKMFPPTLISERYYIERYYNFRSRSRQELSNEVRSLGTLPTTITGNEILLCEIFQIDVIERTIIVVTSRHSGNCQLLSIVSNFVTIALTLRVIRNGRNILSPSTLVRIINSGVIYGWI